VTVVLKPRAPATPLKLARVAHVRLSTGEQELSLLRSILLQTHVLNLHAAWADSLFGTRHRLLPVDCSQSTQ
jgi:hypothetical protein